MLDFQNTSRHLPSNTSHESSYPLKTELVNEELEHQNHRLQKNLLKEEKLIQKYHHNENYKQMIVQNEWNKYNHLLQNERNFLSLNSIWRDGNRFYYQPYQNHRVISGTKDEIEREISSRNLYNLHFVDDLNDVKEIRFDTIFVSIKSIDTIAQYVYDPNMQYGKVNYYDCAIVNDFIKTQYLEARIHNYALSNNLNFRT